MHMQIKPNPALTLTLVCYDNGLNSLRTPYSQKGKSYWVFGLILFYHLTFFKAIPCGIKPISHHPLADWM